MPKISPSVKGPRLVYTYDNASASTTPLSYADLFMLKVFTGSRFVYAFTDSRVAGAVCQTNMLDYRNLESSQGEHSHFGPPLSCVEFKLKNSNENMIGDTNPRGRLVVNGPAVVGGVVDTHQPMYVPDDNTLAYSSNDL